MNAAISRYLPNFPPPRSARSPPRPRPSTTPGPASPGPRTARHLPPKRLRPIFAWRRRFCARSCSPCRCPAPGGGAPAARRPSRRSGSPPAPEAPAPEAGPAPLQPAFKSEPRRTPSARRPRSAPRSSPPPRSAAGSRASPRRGRRPRSPAARRTRRRSSASRRRAGTGARPRPRPWPTGFSAALRALDATLSDRIARLLAPVLTDALRRQAMAELSGALARLLGQPQAANVRVSGPEDLLAALAARSAPSPTPCRSRPRRPRRCR